MTPCSFCGSYEHSSRECTWPRDTDDEPELPKPPSDSPVWSDDTFFTILKGRP